MAYTAKQKSYIDQFSRDYLAATGVTREDLRTSLARRESYNKAMGRYVAANPQIFSPDQVQTAEIIKVTPIRQLGQFTFGDAADIFFTEAGQQATRINPFSALTPAMNQILILAAIVTVSAVIAYKVTPKIPVKK